MQEARLYFDLGHTDSVNSLAVTKGNEFIVSASRDSFIRVWDFKKRKLVAILQGHTDSVKCINITSDNKSLISSSLDKTIRIWNLETKKEDAKLVGMMSSCIVLSLLVIINF